MERQQTVDDVIQFVAKHFKVDPQTLSGSSDLMQVTDADSIDFLELILEMEDVFNTAISDEDAEQLQTIDDVADFVIAHSK
ncbi:acyl carrier protein [Weissella viridescens]|uniref:Acyl carrier protein n=1 Tax=Weissella viridescens TaxID=1629 RepID=A0A3P2RB67_WEIVI|nr:phosphopantetheine-binding protein [Weissella viridescens]RRG17989.1 acyl carrier protein [Weissella viridescens]